MKQLSAKLKSRGAPAVVLTLALGAAVYLNWSFSARPRPVWSCQTLPGCRRDLGAGRRADPTDPLMLETAARCRYADDER